MLEEISRVHVEDTVKELLAPGRGDALHHRLNEFTALHKFVVDTLVRRTCVDPILRDKVNHLFVDITPDAVRGKTMTFTMTSGKLVNVSSLKFSNSRNITVPTTLGVILLMKHLNDPFIYWLMGNFSGGALAPPEAAPGTLSKTSKQSIIVSPDASVVGAQHPPASGKRPKLFSSSEDASVSGSRGGPHARTGAVPNSQGVSGPPVPQNSAARSSISETVLQWRACFLSANGAVVAHAHVHPEFVHFHSRRAPPTVVTVFLREVPVRRSDTPYPLGQDEHLCLEKGNPSSSPVPLSSINHSYRLAWRVCDIGYVES